MHRCKLPLAVLLLAAFAGDGGAQVASGASTPVPAGVAIETFLAEPCPGGAHVLDREFYVICYSGDWKIARWVGYLLTPDNLKGRAARTDDFRADSGLVPAEQSRLVDYRGSGYDRGHMAPAGAFKRSRPAMSRTFLLSNMAPQTPRLNRRTWRDLETQVRNLARTGGRTWVFTGNLFLDADGNVQPVSPSRIGGARNRSGVAVPTHCFKVVLHEADDGTRRAFGFVMPNQRRRIAGASIAFVRSVDEIEALTDLDFFTFLDRAEQDRLESSTEAPSIFD